MKHDFKWAGFLLSLMFVTASLPAEEPQVVPEVAKLAFEQLIVNIRPFQGEFEQLKFESPELCWYKIDERKGARNVPARSGAVFRHTLSQERVRRLNKLLEETKWLTAEGAEGHATNLHADTVRLVLKRDGNERSVTCEGERPQPYGALLHELAGIAVQERRIYLHDYLPRREGSTAWAEIGSELAALRGDPFEKSPYNIDYDRYLPVAQRIIHKFHTQTEEELIPALRLVAYLRAQAELKYVHRMADDRSGSIRMEVAKALGKIHDKNSLPVLANMMTAAGTRREVGFEMIQWGDEATPEIVKLIEQSTNDDEDVRTQGEDMIRAYLDNWGKVTKPLDPVVVKAVQTALNGADPRNAVVRTTYHKEFLQRAEEN